MPAAAAVNGCVQVVQFGTLNGIACNNVLHVGRLAGTGGGDFGALTGRGPIGQADLDAIALAVRNGITGAFQARCHTGMKWLDCVATDLTSSSGLTGVRSSITSGTNTGAQLPNSAAICISWKSGRRYRGGHPRTYMGGLTTTDCVDGHTIVAAQRTAWLASAQSLFNTLQNIADSAGGLFAPVALHRVQNKAVLAVPLTDRITAVAVDGRVDSQRRRLGKPIA